MLSIILNAKSSDDVLRCRCCLPTPGLVVRCLLMLLPRLFIDPRNGVIVAADADAATANAADLPRAVVRAEEAEADDDDECEPLLLSPSRDEDDVAAAF